MIIRVAAILRVGMHLQRVRLQNTVTDRIRVTAIGEQKFLATDTEGKEHAFNENDADEYLEVYEY